MKASEIDRERGFSILEVLVAVSILAAIVALVLPTIRNAASAESRVTAMALEWSRHQAVERTLRDLLRQGQAAVGEASEYLLESDGYTLSFLTRPDGHDGLAMAHFIIEGQRLSLNLQPVPSTEGDTYNVILADGLDDLRFYFYGERPDAEGMEWRDEWGEDYPPRLVVLDMSREDGQLRRIEALVGGSAPLDCEFDSGHGICLGAG
jgi:prepilin-type N-terminal cleavage/methylation domain-containing protein